MEHRRQKLTRHTEHGGDHQQQSLSRRIGGGQRTGLQRTVAGAGSTGLGLHLNDLYRLAEEVLFTLRSPLVHGLGHLGRRGDGIDGRDLCKCVRGIGRGGITVHDHFLFHTIPSLFLISDSLAAPRGPAGQRRDFRSALRDAKRGPPVSSPRNRRRTVLTGNSRLYYNFFDISGRLPNRCISSKINTLPSLGRLCTFVMSDRHTGHLLRKNQRFLPLKETDSRALSAGYSKIAQRIFLLFSDFQILIFDFFGSFNLLKI